jgi:hypothetical protein
MLSSSKEEPMKHIARITLSASGLALLGLLALSFASPGGLMPVVHAATASTLTLDIAVDCKTVVSGDHRGDTFFINGKIFPGGTFPPGAINNDPVQPYNGVAPIGEFAVRGQHAISVLPNDPFSVTDPNTYYGQHYISSSAPLGTATLYFLLKGGKSAIIGAGYDLGPTLPPPQALLAIVGGIGDYSGASGQFEDDSIGLNSTGCANARVIFTFRPGTEPSSIVINAPAQTTQKQLVLDASKTTDPDGLQLTYAWNQLNTNIQAGIANANTATPMVTFSTKGDYTFGLTVTNSKGAATNRQVTVTYLGQ